MTNDPDRPWLDDEIEDEGPDPIELGRKPVLVKPRGSAIAGADPVYIFRIRVASNIIEVLELRGKEGRNLHVVDPESQARTVILDAGVYHKFDEAKAALLLAHADAATAAQELLNAARARHAAAQHFNLG